MVKALSIFIIFACLVFMTKPVLSNTTASKFVNVSIEIHGLDESAKTLNKATLELASKLSQIKPDAGEMTVEQLRELAIVIEGSNQLVAAVNSVVANTGASIESLKGPTKVLVSEAMTSAYQNSVDPAIQSIDSAVTRWIIFGVIGLILIVALVGFYIYFTTKQIRAAVGILKSITDDYEIVPKKLAQETGESEP